MSRPPDALQKLREARERADEQKRKMLERHQAQQAAATGQRQAREAQIVTKRARFSSLQLASASTALKEITLADLDAQQTRPAAHLNRPTCTLVETFLQVLTTGNSVALLQWPTGLRDASILHPLAMLGVLGSPPERRTGDYRWCSPVPDFRTLVFPWRGAASGAPQRRMTVDRNTIIDWNKLHLTRRAMQESELTPQLADLHQTLGHLTGLKARDVSMPHLAHPSLDELYPTFTSGAGEIGVLPFQSASREFLGRISHGAKLKRLIDLRCALSEPRSAPFALFGVGLQSELEGALCHPALATDRTPDICLLDLGPPGFNRLGHDWETSVEQFLSCLSTHHAGTPVLAMTMDTYVHRRLPQLFQRAGLTMQPAEQGASRVVVRISDDLASDDPEVSEVSPVEFRFHTSAGHGSAALQALSAAARRTRDSASAGSLRRHIGDMRRAMSMPCGLGDATALLADRDAGAVSFLEQRSEGTIGATIKRLIEAGADPDERQALSDAATAVHLAFQDLESDTPVGSLLGAIASTQARKSSPSMFAFASDYDLLLAEHRFKIGQTANEQVAKRLETGFIKFTTLHRMNDSLRSIESDRTRNSWKQLVIVGPRPGEFAALLGRAWLPPEVIVLSDREFAERLAAIYTALSRHPDLAGPRRIGSRLAGAASAASREAEARNVGPIELVMEPVSAHIDEAIVDLTGDDDSNDRSYVEYTLESGRRMRIRPGSVVVRRESSTEVNPFARATARQIVAGDTIVVPDDAFVQEARTLLPVRILAHARVQVYHTYVETALPSLPGKTRREQARHILVQLQQAGAREIAEGTAVDWLNVAQHKLEPPDRLRPHAPRNWREFKAFMTLLKMPEQLSETVWKEGIEPLRIGRRRAGSLMAQAFVSVLVDPHGGVGLPPEIRSGLSKLRHQASDHLDSVLAVARHDNAKDRVT